MSKQLRMVEVVRHVETFVYVCDNPACERTQEVPDSEFGMDGCPESWYALWRRVADPPLLHWLACSPACLRAVVDGLEETHA